MVETRGGAEPPSPADRRLVPGGPVPDPAREPTPERPAPEGFEPGEPSAARPVVGGLVMAAGALALAFGVFCIGAYVVGAVDVVDEADRSWLFWGLAILLWGLGAAGAGAALVAWGRRLRTPDSTTGAR